MDRKQKNERINLVQCLVALGLVIVLPAAWAQEPETYHVTEDTFAEEQEPAAKQKQHKKQMHLQTYEQQ